jgi:hypothetical protein
MSVSLSVLPLVSVWLLVVVLAMVKASTLAMARLLATELVSMLV